MAYAPGQILTSLLRDVSRSFYLTLRVLPGAIRPQIGLAYLLARTSDTIADTELVPLDQRLGALEALRERILGLKNGAPDFGELARHQATLAERSLLDMAGPSLDLLRSQASADQERIVAVLETIISGQELDLRRFTGASANHIIALHSGSELDDYAYRVAGCVGEFWTKMCRAHLFPNARLDDSWLLANGMRFGKGLQLVNILRDLPVDLRKGRCYMPSEELITHGLVSQDLLDPIQEARLRPLYNAWLDQAQNHLLSGWAYTNRLPRRCVRVRLACAWPLLLGGETLTLLRNGRILDPDRRLKVTRSRLRRILLRSVVYYPWTARWQRLFPCH